MIHTGSHSIDTERVLHWSHRRIEEPDMTSNQTFHRPNFSIQGLSAIWARAAAQESSIPLGKIPTYVGDRWTSVGSEACTVALRGNTDRVASALLFGRCSIRLFLLWVTGGSNSAV
jgi:hypothetical protein